MVQGAFYAIYCRAIKIKIAVVPKPEGRDEKKTRFSHIAIFEIRNINVFRFRILQLLNFNEIVLNQIRNLPDIIFSC